ncbi:MAG: hypothetical protein COA71_03165 [SAR86 cluster bacterium]|uniref:Uncharacterized protein n=1 Tax=SAR86 cluster bacterium TaxID=2030880 RepID=A0A2A5CGL0_9GAMM|nr:MAG: hypothetical protein COA71_03165 [SAR86 cluster bacterium]
MALKVSIQFYSDTLKKNPGMHIALGASLVIHLAIIGFAYTYSFGAKKSSEPDHNRPSIEVVFVERNPQQPPLQVEDLLEDQIVEIVEIEFAEQVLVNSESNSETEDSIIPRQASVQEQDQLLTFSNEQQAETAQEEAGLNGSGASAFPETFSSSELDDALSSFLQSYRQDLNQNWMEECVRFKNKNLFDECPLGHAYVASLNPVTMQIVKPLELLPLAPGEFLARESFERMTQGDLFNPYLLSGEIPLFGTGGGIITGSFGLLKGALGMTKPNITLLISTELEDALPVVADEVEENSQMEGSAGEAQKFVIRPALFGN